MTESIESGAIKVIEVIGVSSVSFDDAVKNAVDKAAESISAITGVEVQSMSAKVEDGRITQYRSALKLAFIVK